MHIYSLILMQIEHWKLGSYANNLIRLGRIMEYPEGTHRDHGAQALTLHRPPAPAHGDPTVPQGVTCVPSGCSRLRGELPSGNTQIHQLPVPTGSLPALSLPHPPLPLHPRGLQGAQPALGMSRGGSP